MVWVLKQDLFGNSLTWYQYVFQLLEVKFGNVFEFLLWTRLAVEGLNI